MTRITNPHYLLRLSLKPEGLLTVTWTSERVEAKSGEDNITRAESKFALDKRSFWEALRGQPIDGDPVRHDDGLDKLYNGYTSPSSSLLSSFKSSTRSTQGNQSQDVGKDEHHDSPSLHSSHSLQSSATQSSVTYRLPLLHESGTEELFCPPVN